MSRAIASLFDPATQAEARRRHAALFAAAARARRRTLAITGGCLALLGFCVWWIEVDPGRLWSGLARLGWLFQFLFPPSHGGGLKDFAWAMAETVAIAFLGTLIAALLALPAGLAAARNTAPAEAVRVPLRRALDVMRGIDVLVWSLVFVSAVGLGPLAGVLALVVTDFPMLAKLFSEAVENARAATIAGVQAVGASRAQVIRYGILPQTVPVILAQVLYFFESNTRSATVIGIVGAGGIGAQLTDRIRLNAWDEVCFIVLLILVAVGGIDALSRRLRRRLISPRRLHRAELAFAAAHRAT
jgi:phosphonate transport system permease protein